MWYLTCAYVSDGQASTNIWLYNADNVYLMKKESEVCQFYTHAHTNGVQFDHIHAVYLGTKNPICLHMYTLLELKFAFPY